MSGPGVPGGGEEAGEEYDVGYNSVEKGAEPAHGALLFSKRCRCKFRSSVGWAGTTKLRSIFSVIRSPDWRRVGLRHRRMTVRRAHGRRRDEEDDGERADHRQKSARIADEHSLQLLPMGGVNSQESAMEARSDRPARFRDFYRQNTLKPARCQRIIRSITVEDECHVMHLLYREIVSIRMVDVQLKDVHTGTRAGVYVRFSSRSREEKHLHSERNEDNCNNSDGVMGAHGRHRCLPSMNDTDVINSLSCHLPFGSAIGNKSDPRKGHRSRSGASRR